MKEKFKWNKINQEKAYDLFTAGNEVFLLFEDGTEMLVEYVDDILDHCGEYGTEGTN